ncbi:MAG: hypothetical protein H0U90_04610 [Actinobacteria bacterium]|nr:hypothetical protein [Actinomycetota bacterium]
MRTLSDIRWDLDAATERRAYLWERLSEGFDAQTSSEAAGLSRRIEELWQEARIARAHARYGPSGEIITRARAEDRLDREARRWRAAA